MPPTLCIAPDTVRTDPDVDGLTISDGEWELDVGRYRAFITRTTGIEPTDDLSASDCYRIGNHLQALVEERKRNDEWDRRVVEQYPDIQSLEEVLWIARFFRACHDCHDPVAVTQDTGRSA